MTRDELTARGAEALLKARGHADLRTVPPIERFMAAQVALVVLNEVGAWELLEALKGWQDYELSLEDRQKAAMAAIAKAEGRQ